MQTLEFRAMNCAMSAVIDCDEQVIAGQLAQVPAWFAEWESHLSRFHADSELCRLNRSHSQPFAVSEILWETVQTALIVAEWTGGLVTPTVLGALEAAGYDQSFELIKAEEAWSASRRSAPLEIGGKSGVKLLPERSAYP